MSRAHLYRHGKTGKGIISSSKLVREKKKASSRLIRSSEKKINPKEIIKIGRGDGKKGRRERKWVWLIFDNLDWSGILISRGGHRKKKVGRRIGSGGRTDDERYEGGKRRGGVAEVLRDV